MNDIEHQAIGLQSLARQAWLWLWGNSLSIAIAMLAGAVLVAIMIGTRSFGVWLQKGGPHTTVRIVIGRVLAKMQLWFMVALAAEVVADITMPPVGVVRLIRFAFTVTTALQAAIWLRELVLGWVEHRAMVNAEDHGSLASAIGIIRLLVSVAAFALAAILILDNLGVNVTALVAGLGVGGIAIGLAAQGIFSDLFAALSILFDKPFRKGDGINWDTTNGTVESIGLKTTRIRAATGERVVISNANLLGKEVRNFAHLTRRQIGFTLALIYQTPREALETIPDLLKTIVGRQPKCVFVRSSFVTFNASSLDYELLFDVHSSDYNEVTATRTRIALDIIGEFASRGIRFAYPTQTTFTAAPDGTLLMPYPDHGAPELEEVQIRK